MAFKIIPEAWAIEVGTGEGIYKAVGYIGQRRWDEEHLRRRSGRVGPYAIRPIESIPDASYIPTFEAAQDAYAVLADLYDLFFKKYRVNVVRVER